MTTVILTLLALGLIIAVHELGHFIAAKMSNIKVLEYSIGMGPLLTKIKRGETVYSLRLLLVIGGYVRMAGAHPDEPEANDERGLLAQPVRTRAWVFAAGSLMNLVLGILLFTLAYGVIGLTTFTLTLSEVVPDMPAEQAGIQPGDQVVSLDGEDVTSWEQFATTIHVSADRPVDVGIIRNGTEKGFTVTPQENPDGVGLIGVAPTVTRVRTPLHTAIGRGFSDTAMTIVLWVSVIFMMITGRMQGELVGPIGAGQFIGQAAGIGPDILLLVVGQISVVIGLFNLLPIPMLDGSRLVFLGIERIRGKPINPNVEQTFHLVGFVLLITLALVIAYRDILRLWSG